MEAILLVKKLLAANGPRFLAALSDLDCSPTMIPHSSNCVPCVIILLANKGICRICIKYVLRIAQ